jgi:Fe-S-cluster containining protein
MPLISGVDTAIFIKTFYAECMECTFCHDACCHHGADVTALDHGNIQAQADEVEEYLGLPRSRWFSRRWQRGADWPGGKATRTRVERRRCVFLNRRGRGCGLHSYALGKGIDVHEIKPMVCLLWPVTWWEGVLLTAEEIHDNSMICLGPGRTCYQSSRNDIGYYFGAALVSELDGLEARALKDLPPDGTGAKGRRVSLPITKPRD